MTDRLSLANAPAEAKIDRPAAERIATEIFDAIHESVATKADVAAVQMDVQRLEGRIDALRGEMNLRFSEFEHRIMTRLGGLIVVVAGLLFAALRYLTPAH